MEMFSFQLKPIAQCALPGDEIKSMSWFYLTDCWYSIRLGETVLFRASPQWVEKYSGPLDLDYYYIRWLEDFWYILPQVATQIPPDLYALMDSEEKRRAALERLDAFWDANEGENGLLPQALEDLYLTAQGFLCHGVLDTGFLRFRSLCRFCRVGDEMVIHYDFRDQDEEGVPVWSAGAGRYALPYARFVEEIDGMLQRFFPAMEEQIRQAVEAARQNPGMYQTSGSRQTSDPKEILLSLLEEQNRRKKDFYQAWDAAKEGRLPPPTPWEDIRFALNQTGLLPGTQKDCLKN